MWKTITDIWKAHDLRSKILWTVGLLVVFRFMAVIPIPFANLSNLQKLFDSNQILGMLSMFSGGALEKFSIVALGVGPYINASIIMQLLTVLIPQLEALSKEGEQGRQTINRYTRYLTVPLAIVQSWGLIYSVSANKEIQVFTDLTVWQQVFIVLTWTAGTVFLMWLGEIITEKGVGNGVSMIIFAGIVVDYPRMFTLLGRTADASQILGIVLLVALLIIIVAAIVLINEAERQIPVAYAKRVRGTKMYGGGGTHLPLRLNQAGVIPIIFANSILIFPQMIASFFSQNTGTIKQVADAVINFLSPSKGVTYEILTFLLVALFTYFYTFVTFNPDDVSENIQKQGGFIVGIRPGKPTADFLRRVLFRITLAGALFLALIAIFPYVLAQIVGAFSTLDISSFQLRGTGLLIVVSVVLETVKQLETMLVMRNYDGIMRKRSQAG
ncbi:MAG: preprotein translocase subunit SecY [bacterium]